MNLQTCMIATLMAFATEDARNFDTPAPAPFFEQQSDQVAQAKPQPPIDTLQVLVKKGAVFTNPSGQYTMTFKDDHTYTFKTPTDLITGRWRVDGDKLCTASTATPQETCTTYPKGKASGDTFDIQSATLGGTKVKIN